MKLKYDLFDMVSASIMNSEPIVIVLPQLKVKRADLEAFATLFGLSVQDIKLIAKGKWYLHWFVNQAYPKIKQLREACKNEIITQCRSCKVGNYDDCLFKTKQDKYKIDILKDDLLTFVDLVECSDLVDVLATLN